MGRDGILEKTEGETILRRKYFDIKGIEKPEKGNEDLWGIFKRLRGSDFLQQERNKEKEIENIKKKKLEDEAEEDFD